MTRLAICIATLGSLWAPAADAQGRVFEAPVGVMLNYIKTDSTEDFEAVMSQVASALANSDNDVHRAMAEGWYLMRARESGPEDSVLYLWWIDPVPAGADYSISTLLNEYYPADVQELYQQFSGSYAGGQSMINLDRIIHFGSAESSVPGALPETETPGQTSPGGGPEDAVITQHCADEWPTDFQMRAFCQQQQEESVGQLGEGACHSQRAVSQEVAGRKRKPGV